MRRLLLTMSIAYAGPAVALYLRPAYIEQAPHILATLAAVSFFAAWALHSVKEQGRA